MILNNIKLSRNILINSVATIFYQPPFFFFFCFDFAPGFCCLGGTTLGEGPAELVVDFGDAMFGFGDAGLKKK